MKTNKLSFKNHLKLTGLASVDHPHQSADILSDKKCVGTIRAPNAFSKDNFWRVGLMIVKTDIMEDGNPNCPWKWIQFKNTFEDRESAKEWVKTRWESFNQKYNIRKEED